MEPTKIIELQEQRATEVTRMREILDGAHAENRDFTADERTEYDNLELNVDATAGRIETERKLRERELGLEHRGIDPRELQVDLRETAGGDKAAEHRKAFGEYLRQGELEIDPESRAVLSSCDREIRAQAKGTSNLGGYLVPTDFQRSLAMHAIQAGTVRRTNATVLVTGSGEALQVPKTTAHGAASWTAEAATSTSNDETFGQITLQAYTVRRLILVSQELVEDEAVDLEAYLAREIGRSIGALENTGYLNGSGTGQPTGLVGLSSSGKVGLTGQTLTVIADDIFDLFYSVIPPYRVNASFMLGDATIKAIRKLKDANGQYLWAPGMGGTSSVLANAAPDSLLGKALYDDPDMPVMAANAKSILFGDFSAYYIRDVGVNGPDPDSKPIGSFSVRRLNERYADNMQIGFLGYHRTDGNLVDATGAVKYYANSAT